MSSAQETKLGVLEKQGWTTSVSEHLLKFSQTICLLRENVAHDGSVAQADLHDIPAIPKICIHPESIPQLSIPKVEGPGIAP